MAVDIIARAMAAKANSGGGTQPDLSNYVQFDDYPSNEKAGVVKSHINGFQVSENGNPNAAILSKEQYDTIENQYFISKGTLENIKDDYVESSTPVKNLNNSLKNLIPKQNAEGTDNVFDDGLKSPLYALGGDGKSEQKTTTGKNLFDYTTVRSTSGLTTTINTDGSITTKGTPTESYIKLVLEKDYNDKLDDGETYTISQDVAGYIYLQIYAVPKDGGSTIYYASSNSQTRKEASFTVDKSIYDYKATLQSGLLADVGENINFTAKFQLEKGSTATSDEPYTGGQPSPSPDYEQPINSIEGSLEFACNGRNLLPNNASSQTINDVIFIVKDDGSVIVNGTATARVNLFLFADSENPIKLIPGNYSLNSGKTIGGSFLQIEVKNSLGESRYITSSNTPNNNVVINEGDVLVAGYIGVDQGQTATNDHIYPVFQKGATSTKYEPYVEPNKVTFNLNDEKLRSVGDVKDELVVDLSTGDYYKVENVGEVVLDGSTDENWGNVPDGTSKERYTSSIIQNLVYTGTKLCQSNYFKSGTSENYYEDGTIRIAPSGGVSIYDDLFTSMDNFKQWLSTNNTIVNYILKKPTTKKLGTLSAEDLAKLKTFKGYNNVTVNTNLGLMNIRFTYGLDIKKYIDNKIAELSAQLIKGE